MLISPVIMTSGCANQFSDNHDFDAKLNSTPRLWKIAMIVLAIALCGDPSLSAVADEAATLGPSCKDGPSYPEYAPLDAAPNVRYRKDVRLPALPFSPACVGIAIPEIGTFVEVAGTFRFTDSKSALLSKIGNISTLLQVRYWSATDHAWRQLFTAVTALTALGQPRDDFKAAELETGQDLFLSQTDNRSTNAAVYMMRLRESLARRFILEIENVSPVRWWALTLYNPGELHSVYLFEQRSAELWTYYSLTTIGGGHHLVPDNERSSINRVVAMYRHYTGVATDSEPPPAP